MASSDAVSLGLDRRSVSYVSAYVLLWAAHAIVLKSTAVDSSGQFAYAVASCTWLSELVKLFVGLCVLRCTHPYEASLHTLRLAFHERGGLLFALPAGFYLVYNGLAYVNLSLLDPATYRVLINIRVLFSGLLLQYFFSTTLIQRQWLALLLLALGCAVEQLGSFSIDSGVFSLFTMSVQALCSSLGGVYFQWLLQRQVDTDRAEPSLWHKNVWMYVWSLLFNGVYIIAIEPQLVIPSKFFAGITFRVWIVIALAAAAGMSTSLLLQHLNVLTKEYANFAEMVLVSLAQYIFFDKPLRWSLLFGIILVSYSVYMFKTASGDKSAGKSLRLPTTDESDDMGDEDEIPLVHSS